MAANWASGLQVSRWAKELQSEVSKGVYFSKFMGEGPGNAIHVKQIEDGKGKDVTFGLVTQLTGSAITGDSSLEGNEQSLSTFSNTVTTNQKRLAVRDTGKFANSKVLYDFRSTSLDLLKTQYSELIDADIFSALSATSGTHAYYRADASASVYATSDPKAALADADSITLADISALKTLAQIGGSANYRMRPIRVDGNDYYVLVLHPEVAYDLFELDEFQQMQREAQVRGEDNPLFKGALGIYNGVVIHAHEGVNTFDNGGGAAVKGSRNLFMGAQAACFAESSDMMWVEKTFDYGNQLGISAAKIYGVEISDYNSKDYGVIQYVSARTDLS
jgi:N4-gp56 family major capsid protein|tara:strand:+ start:19 stop:1017 length:999 start_codon:yes stop_codon:yes gene_type:complete